MPPRAPRHRYKHQHAAHPRHQPPRLRTDEHARAAQQSHRRPQRLRALLGHPPRRRAEERPDLRNHRPQGCGHRRQQHRPHRPQRPRSAQTPARSARRRPRQPREARQGLQRLPPPGRPQEGGQRRRSAHARGRRSQGSAPHQARLPASHLRRRGALRSQRRAHDRRRDLRGRLLR